MTLANVEDLDLIVYVGELVDTPLIVGNPDVDQDYVAVGDLDDDGTVIVAENVTAVPAVIVVMSEPPVGTGGGGPGGPTTAAGTSIVDTAGHYTSSNVEGALAEIGVDINTALAGTGGGPTTAAVVSIVDVGEHLISTNVEGGLQEVAEIAESTYEAIVTHAGNTTDAHGIAIDQLIDTADLSEALDSMPMVDTSDHDKATFSTPVPAPGDPEVTILDLTNVAHVDDIAGGAPNIATDDPLVLALDTTDPDETVLVTTKVRAYGDTVTVPDTDYTMTGNQRMVIMSALTADRTIKVRPASSMKLLEEQMVVDDSGDCSDVLSIIVQRADGSGDTIGGGQFGEILTLVVSPSGGVVLTKIGANRFHARPVAFQPSPTVDATSTHTTFATSKAVYDALPSFGASDAHKLRIYKSAGVWLFDVENLASGGKWYQMNPAIDQVLTATEDLSIRADASLVTVGLFSASRLWMLPPANACPAGHKITCRGPSNLSAAITLGIQRSELAAADTIADAALSETTVFLATPGATVTFTTNGEQEWTVEYGVAPADYKATTKGDLLVATGNSTLVRKGVGAFNQTLKADAAETDGMVWGHSRSLRERHLAPNNSHEVFPRNVQMGNIAVPTASGTVYLVGIALPKNLVVTSITFGSMTTAAIAPTNWWFALCNSTFVQLRRTADQTTTAWAATSVKTVALTSTFTTTYEGIHYLAIMMAAGTIISMQGVTQTSGAFANTTPRTSLTGLTGQTAPSADGTNLAPSPVGHWMTPYAYVL